MFRCGLFSLLAVALLAGGAVSLGAADMDGQGFILHWLILGPYTGSGAANPGETAIRADYLTDGDVDQMSIAPFPGLIVETNYAIAASTGLVPTPNASHNPSGKPEWYDYVGSQDTIDFQAADLFSSSVDQVMSYACVYVENLTGAAISNVRVACASDDSIQVYLNTDEVWINNVARGVGGSGQIADNSGRFTLPVGVSRLMVKVFEGGGDYAFRLRLEDGSNNPLLSNRLGISVEPFGPCPESVSTYADSWLREVTFAWENRYSTVEIWEGGVKIAETDDPRLSELTVSGIALGEHFYQFRSKVGDNEPACDPVACYVEMVPVWPADFSCAFSDGVVSFEWRNLEGYYEVLKIQDGGNDILGVSYGLETAQVVGLSAGTYTFELVAELGGYASQGVTCEVEVTGPPPEFRRGDANGDGSVNVADAVMLLGFLFSGDQAPACLDSGDANDDGKLDISDPVGVLRHLFSGGAIPAPGAQSCGLDTTPDALTRCAYGACE